MEASGMVSTVTEIVSGGTRGVDRLGERYAYRHGLPCKVFPAQWAKHGRSAGPLRNMEFVELCARYGWDFHAPDAARAILTAPSDPETRLEALRRHIEQGYNECEKS